MVEAAAVVVVAEVEIVIIVIVAMIVEVEEIVAKVEVPNVIVVQGEHHQEDRHLLVKQNLDGIQVQKRNHQDGETHHQRKNQLVKDGVMPHQIKMTHHQNRKQEVDGEQVQNKMKEQVVGVKKNQKLMIKQNPMYRYPNQSGKTQLSNRHMSLSQCRTNLQSLIKSLMKSLNQPQFRLQFHLQHKTTKTLPLTPKCKYFIFGRRTHFNPYLVLPLNP